MNLDVCVYDVLLRESAFASFRLNKFKSRENE